MLGAQKASTGLATARVVDRGLPRLRCGIAYRLPNSLSRSGLLSFESGDSRSDLVRGWLEAHGLGSLAGLFEENLIDEEALLELTDSDLIELGLALGPRVKLRGALKDLQRQGWEGLRADAMPSSQAKPAQAAERRQLTVMFVDLVDSTGLAGKLDPEDMSAVLRTYQDTCAGAITRFDGHVARYMGDGILAYFGWPQAHEDEVAQAVRAGLAITDAVSHLPQPEDLPLAARVGIATGWVVVGDLVGDEEAQERVVVGETPNLASRLQGAAEPGQVVVSEGTRRLLHARFDLEDLGEHEFKGIEQPSRVFAVVSERTVESRFEATSEALLPMVGRDHELGLILERWDQASSGHGQGMLLVGEAGIGKSRILRALLDALSEQKHMRIRFQCSPYHVDSALWPVVQQVRFTSGITASDSAGERLDKLETTIGIAGGEDREFAQLIEGLMSADGVRPPGSLDLTPEVQRARTLEGLVRWLRLLADRQPVLVVLEDAQWSDPTTLEMIDQALGVLAGSAVMILLTSRPDRQPELGGHAHVTHLALNRLGPRSIEAMVRELNPDKELSPEVVESIVARTDGVPLFAEELTKTVLEIGETEVPASLHDTLMARLDRIPEAKSVAQIASCIGREFGYRLLSMIADVPTDELDDSLDTLISAGLIFGRGSPPVAQYRFKHHLVQDTAHESLLLSQRKATHQRIAEALEHEFEGQHDREPELLARHLTEAERFEEAIPYWEEAGKLSVQRSANIEAIGHLSVALDLLNQLPSTGERDEQELRLCSEIAGPLMATKGYGAPETVRNFEQVQRLADQVGDTTLLFPILYQQWLSPIISGDPAEAIKVARRFVSLAEQGSDSGLILMGQRILGISLFEMAETPTARDALVRVRDLYDRSEHAELRFRYGQDPYAAALSFLGVALFELGYPDQAHATAAAGAEHARDLEHANTLGYALTIGRLTVAWCMNEFSPAGQLADTVISLADQYGMALWRAYALIFKGWSMVMAESNDEGFGFIERGLDGLDATSTRLHRPQLLAMSAQALERVGDVERAMQVVEEALILAQKERWAESELYRIRGSLQASTGHTEDATNSFEHAIDLARQRGAKSWELRTGINLAAVLRDAGQEIKANELLAPLYEGFVEGFDTHDLLRAKALLDEMR